MVTLVALEIVLAVPALERAAAGALAPADVALVRVAIGRRVAVLRHPGWDQPGQPVLLVVAAGDDAGAGARRRRLLVMTLAVARILFAATAVGRDLVPGRQRPRGQGGQRERGQRRRGQTGSKLHGDPSVGRALTVDDL
jgi:hypothetical protein